MGPESFLFDPELTVLASYVFLQFRVTRAHLREKRSSLPRTFCREVTQSFSCFCKWGSRHVNGNGNNFYTCGHKEGAGVACRLRRRGLLSAAVLPQERHLIPWNLVSTGTETLIPASQPQRAVARNEVNEQIWKCTFQIVNFTGRLHLHWIIWEKYDPPPFCFSDSLFFHLEKICPREALDLQLWNSVTRGKCW